jgi:hypothetical protein
MVGRSHHHDERLLPQADKQLGHTHVALQPEHRWISGQDLSRTDNGSTGVLKVDVLSFQDTPLIKGDPQPRIGHIVPYKLAEGLHIFWGGIHNRHPDNGGGSCSRAHGLHPRS